MTSALLGRSDMPALGLAVPVNKGRRKERNRSWVAGAGVKEKMNDQESTDETRSTGLRSTGEMARVCV